MELLSSLASACLGRRLAPRERAALGVALFECAHETAVPTVPMVVEALLSPAQTPPVACAPSGATCSRTAATWRFELRRFVHGDLCGMFDGADDARPATSRRRSSSSTCPRCTRRPRSASSWRAPRPGCRPLWPGRLRRPRSPTGRARSSSWSTRRGRSCRMTVLIKHAILRHD